MNLISLLMDNDKWMPIELVWKALVQTQNGQSKAFRMLEQGVLSAQGRSLLMNDDPNQSGLGGVFNISTETWRDADVNAWKVSKQHTKNFNLRGPNPDDVITAIQILNSEQLRELVGFEKPSISVDEYDDKFFKTTQTKMGAKVWARAAAALAADRVAPTAGKLADYLIKESDIWKITPLDRRNLIKHLGPFVNEYNKLAQFQ